MRGIVTGLGLAVAVIGMSGLPAEAAIINSLVQVGVNQVQDFDAERLLTSTGAYDATHLITAGDFIEAIIRFDTANNNLISSGLGPNYQLTAYSRIQVVSKTPVVGSPGLFDFVMAPGIDDDGDGTFETAIKLYENPTPTAAQKFDVTVSPASGIARATSGSLIATFGFGQLLPVPTVDDDFWIANDAPDNIGVFRLSDPTLQGGDFQFGVSMLTNPGGLDLLTEENGGGVLTFANVPFPVGSVHDLAGDGQLKKVTPQMNIGWDAQTDTLAEFQGIPEPASLLVWSLVFAIGAMFGWRSVRRAK